MENKELIQNINTGMAIELPQNISYEELYKILSAYINLLIKNNFELLVSLLYKIDVSEEKLKYLLLDNPNEDAGKIIATLIIDRQKQKIILKKSAAARFSANDNEEKW
jgi:hypothetical protein